MTALLVCYNSTFSVCRESMSRQPHGDATVWNRRQSPAPSSYHRKHLGSTFLPVPHAPHGYGAPRGRHWEALGGGLLGRRRRRTARPRSERRARRGAPRRSWGWEHNAGDSTGIVPVSPAGNSEVFRVLIPCGSGRELDSAVEKRIWVKNCWVEFKSNTFASLLLRIRF